MEKADFKQFGMSYLSVQGFANNKYWHCAVRPAAAPNVSVDMTVHGSNANYLFADGHAASMKYNTVQWKLFGLQKSDIDNNYCYLGPR